MGSKPRCRSGTQPDRSGECSGGAPAAPPSPWAGCHRTAVTCGPRYRSIAQSYFRKAQGVLLLYDISSPSSFLSARQWIEDIKVGKGPTDPGRGVGVSGVPQGGQAVPQAGERGASRAAC